MSKLLKRSKHVVNEHRVTRRKVMTSHRKNVLRWCISMYHVSGLKQTRAIKNVTLQAKKFVGVAVYWEEQYKAGIFPATARPFIG